MPKSSSMKQKTKQNLHSGPPDLSEMPIERQQVLRPLVQRPFPQCVLRPCHWQSEIVWKAPRYCPDVHQQPSACRVIPPISGRAKDRRTTFKMRLGANVSVGRRSRCCANCQQMNRTRELSIYQWRMQQDAPLRWPTQMHLQVVMDRGVSESAECNSR